MLVPSTSGLGQAVMEVLLLGLLLLQLRDEIDHQLLEEGGIIGKVGQVKRDRLRIGEIRRRVAHPGFPVCQSGRCLSDFTASSHDKASRVPRDQVDGASGRGRT